MASMATIHLASIKSVCCISCSTESMWGGSIRLLGGWEKPQKYQCVQLMTLHVTMSIFKAYLHLTTAIYSYHSVGRYADIIS